MLHADAPSPSFFSRLHTFERSKSYDVPSEESEAESSQAGVRRAISMRVGQNRATAAAVAVDGLQQSFGVAGAVLSPDPPLASRHALFSHHRIPSSQSTPISIDVKAPAPPSPSLSSTSSAFSPASAFLSHFSSNTSLRPSPTLAPDAPGARVLDYTLGKVLGRGGFSTVRLATKSTGEQYACKIVKRDDLSDRSGSLEKFEEEIQIWQSLPRHPSLLPLLEMDRTNFATFLIIPVHLGGNLLDVLRREGGSDKTARKWFPGVVAAVSAMHEGYEGFSGGMLHGDLKLDNFLVDHDGRVVVCDFYMARILGGGNGTTVPVPLGPQRRPRQSAPAQLEPIPLPAHFPSASLPYASPELLSQPTPPTLAQDIWSLGIILYALLTGKLPFVDAFDPRLQMKILRGQWDVPDNMGREWVEVLRGCLHGDRSQRWTIDRVRNSDALVGWKEVKQRSRSRSRRRLDNYGIGADPLTSQPTTPGPAAGRGASRSRQRGASRDARDGSRNRDADAYRRAGSTTREGRSGSTSSGRFLDPDDINLDHLHFRGRSPQVVPALPPFARDSRPASISRTRTSPDQHRSASRGARRPTSANRQDGRDVDRDRYEGVQSSSRQSRSSSSSQSRQRDESPTNALALSSVGAGAGPSSRSRSRTPWAEGMLGVVDEEGDRERGRKGRR